jgi:CMP-N,N'-diacetyllegionaminic acid synthase
VKVLWIVAARSGSKGRPNKSVAKLGGHPMLAWRIAAALRVADAGDVWISTDSPEYAEIARSYGATVPFLRPPELASDTAGSADVVLHAMQHVGDAAYDAVALLQPTSPFVRPATLRAGMDALGAEPDADALVATRTARPSALYVQPDTRYLDVLAARLRDGVQRRQDEQRDVVPSGALYLARWDAFLREGSFYLPKTLNFRVDGDEAVDVDDVDDLALAEHVVVTGRVTPADVGL